MSGLPSTASRLIARLIDPIDKSNCREFKHFGLDVKYQD
jgi:hypothetical protein